MLDRTKNLLFSCCDNKPKHTDMNIKVVIMQVQEFICTESAVTTTEGMLSIIITITIIIIINMLHSCLHEWVPICAILHSMPRDMKADVSWPQIGFNGSYPCLSCSSSGSPPASWCTFACSSEGSSMIHLGTGSDYMAKGWDKTGKTVSNFRAKAEWLYGHVMAPYKLSYYYYYFFFDPQY